jgi:GTP-binding protein HflX
VEKILGDLGLRETPLLRIFNKSDRIDPEIGDSVVRRYGGIRISALDSKTFSPLLQGMEEKLFLPKADPQAWSGRELAETVIASP